MATSTWAEAPDGNLPLQQARRRHLVLCFEGFALDPARFELRRGEASVPLAPQPFDLLWLLASRPGALVGRDEIRRALWDGGTFVEFDGCVNFCVRVLRKVLADDARRPRFIQAVRGRGYRFIAPVAVVADEGWETAL
ncbi:MAG TPA: winged helix-turn-helix domain-containing protein [Vicinamibacteria bacterium]|nr:winged helix-turn-helix domain-containing protein [Vicinamibacteria bacterium]